MTLFNWIHLPILNDHRGSLVAVESSETISFEIRRVYYLYGIKPGAARGFHAHEKLQQVAICLKGKCRLVLDDGIVREEAWLDSPSKGLFIKELVWREMYDFSEDCVLLVLASDHYDEADYIRDYKEFLAKANHSGMPLIDR